MTEPPPLLRCARTMAYVFLCATIVYTAVEGWVFRSGWRLQPVALWGCLGAGCVWLGVEAGARATRMTVFRTHEWIKQFYMQQIVRWIVTFTLLSVGLWQAGASSAAVLLGFIAAQLAYRGLLRWYAAPGTPRGTPPSL